jgi:hypothetical protein
MLEELHLKRIYYRHALWTTSIEVLRSVDMLTLESLRIRYLLADSFLFVEEQIRENGFIHGEVRILLSADPPVLWQQDEVRVKNGPSVK